MDIYVAIYVQRYPEQLNDMSYAHFVKDLMKHNANWQFYDSHFRSDRESKCSWLGVCQDLELHAFRVAASSYNGSNQTRNFRQRVLDALRPK